MKLSVSLLRAIIWSLLLSIIVRIIYGIHAVYGIPALLIPLILGTATAIFLTPPKIGKFIFTAIVHMGFITLFTALLDLSGLFNSLAGDSAVFFSKFTEANSSQHNFFFSILLVNTVYFFSYVINGCICFRIRASSLAREEEYDLEETGDEFPTE